MIDFNFSKECYSCFLCGNICPTGAISFNASFHPIIDKNKCINCNKCDNYCIKLSEIEYKIKINEENNGYICKNKSITERKNSSSGGIFILLAKKILSEQGYVCGCIYDENFNPKHILSNKISDIEKMMGSKYVMSDLNNCMIQIEKKLKEGIEVLFSGVPCQVAAIKKYLGKYENLKTISVVCHGSIERNYWIKFLESKKSKGKILNITMRDKTKGWLNYGLRITYETGEEDITYRKEDGYFLKCFTDGIFDRDRCLNCKYKGSEIKSDILLGDAWGGEILSPKLYDELGVSVVICLTKNGKEMLEKIKKEIEFERINIEKIIEKNQRIISSPKNNFFRILFKKSYDKNLESVEELCKKFSKDSILKKILRKINFL